MALMTSRPSPAHKTQVIIVYTIHQKSRVAPFSHLSLHPMPNGLKTINDTDLSRIS
jgi:hypothetical protein